ncbi:MAG: AI-2E family transporter [Chitinophagaceae bacterium]
MQLPFYIRVTIILLGLCLFVFILFTLKAILVPFALAGVIAMLLNPAVIWLQKRKINHVIAITISVVSSIVLILLIAWFLVSQMARVGQDFPAMQQKFEKLFHSFQQTLNDDAGVTMEKQQDLIDKGKESLGTLAGTLAGSMLGSLSVIVLLPVYLFLLLYYKQLILNFIYEIIADQYAGRLDKVLSESKTAIQKYMSGLMLETLIVATLNSTALVIIGVKYGILIGVIGALLNLIPYIGGIIAIALPVVVATVTKDGFHAQLFVIASYLVIQFVDNHYLLPVIVSSKVRINALVSIVATILAGMLWGIAGMFLCIPLVGILKIAFDRIPGMEPWGRLLGDEMPTVHRGILLKRKRKKVSAT